MPRGDGTGPNGQGSMTGRRRGFCAGFNTPGFMNSGFGRGFARGRGFGWKSRFVHPISQQVQSTTIREKQEKQFLEQELTALKEEVKEIERRLKEMNE